MNKTEFVKLWNAEKSQYKKIYLKYDNSYIYAESCLIENSHAIAFYHSGILCSVVHFNDILRIKGVKNLPKKYKEDLHNICDYD
ncbi:MAG: hypothetical protein QXH07_02095 [Thermoplasmata archaeon]